MSRFKLQQIVRLREMLRKWRRLSHKARSVESSSPAAAPRETRTSRVPPGHLAVYVGHERTRFVIKTSLLAHPLFKALLRKTEEEIGFHYEGGLALPCDVSAFQHLLLLMQGKHTSHNALMMHDHAHAEQDDDDDDVHGSGEEKLQQRFLLLLRELLHLHYTDRSGHLVNRCLPRPPLTSLLQPVF